MNTEEFFQSSTPIQSLLRLTRRSSGHRLCRRRLACPLANDRNAVRPIHSENTLWMVELV